MMLYLAAASRLTCSSSTAAPTLRVTRPEAAPLRPTRPVAPPGRARGGQRGGARAVSGAARPRPAGGGGASAAGVARAAARAASTAQAAAEQGRQWLKPKRRRPKRTRQGLGVRWRTDTFDASLDELHAVIASGRQRAERAQDSKLLHISHARIHAPLSPASHRLGQRLLLTMGLWRHCPSVTSRTARAGRRRRGGGSGNAAPVRAARADGARHADG